MSSEGTRTRILYERREKGREPSVEQWLNNGGAALPTTFSNAEVGAQKTVSVSHPRSRDGAYREGGPFYTSLVRDFVKPAHMVNCYKPSNGRFYTGPIYGKFPTEAEMKALSYKNISRKFGDSNESSLLAKGTTAISQSAPTNPASDLGTTLAETFREGVPSLPGIQQWKAKTEILKGLGSEYLNYQFGWAPLQSEVHSVVATARNHRDLLSQYRRGEGSDTHRTFRFPSNNTFQSIKEEEPGLWAGPSFELSGQHGTRQVSLVRETKCWFEGCFTYALPSSTDSWRGALGYGSDADKLYGLALTPDVLWELTPWSWAVDWFSNAGDVINNVTNFGLAGLVLRYGYMMEESIERITASGTGPTYNRGTLVFTKNKEAEIKEKLEPSGTYSCGTECVTKVRTPASPFGFSVGWEGLSPTQLAITAALGITRLL